MNDILKQTNDIDVVYCENDGEALGAIDAMEEAGLKCNAEPTASSSSRSTRQNWP